MSIDLPYAVDFEQGVEATGLAFSNGMYQWFDGANSFKMGMDNFGLTGPSADHTFGTLPDGSTPGHYLVTDAGGGQLGDAIVAQSRCIDLSQTVSPEIRYWYHMFGFQMGNLYLQINDDTGWRTEDSLFAQDPDHRTNFSDWKSRTIKLDRYKGKYIRYRFISFRGNGTASNMALDDIVVYDLAAKDISPISLAAPTADSSSCYSEKNPFCLNLRNNGSDSIDFKFDSTFIDVIVFKDNQGDGNYVQVDSLHQLVIKNYWVNVNGDTFALPRDSIVEIKFDSTFDMSDTGSYYRFIVDVQMVSDLITGNDQYDVEVKSQRKTGQIVSILPNDTVCFGTQITATVRNNFGALRWEEKYHRKNGNDFLDYRYSLPS